MKRLKKITLCLLSVMILMLSCTSCSVHANSEVIALKEKDPDKDKGDDTKNETGQTSDQCDPDDQKCLAKRKATIKTAPFITQAIISLDEETAKKELSEDYIKHFMNSSATAVTDGINLFHPDTILLALINFVTSIVEKLGLCVSLIVMIFYNMSSSTFINTIVRNIFNVLEKALFNWDDPNAYIYKLFIVACFIVLIRKLMGNMKLFYSWKAVLQVILQVTLTGILCYLLARYGRPAIIHIENQASDAFLTTFSIGDNDPNTPIEIQNKRMLFENMQKQGFILRHFGVVDVSQIPEIKNVSNSDRVEYLLSDPSTDNAEAEYDAGNESISYNSGQALQVLTLSIFFIIHRVFIGLLFIGASGILIAISLIKEILLALAAWQLIYAILKNNKQAYYWVGNRLQWSVLAILSYFVFNTFLYFIQSAVTQISAYGIFLLLPFDIILFFLGKFAIKRLPEMLANLNSNDDGILQTAKGIFKGEVSPKDIYNDYTSKKATTDEDVEEKDQEIEKNRMRSNLTSDNDDNLAEPVMPDETIDTSSDQDADLSENVAINEDGEEGTTGKNENLNQTDNDPDSDKELDPAEDKQLQSEDINKEGSFEDKKDPERPVEGKSSIDLGNNDELLDEDVKSSAADGIEEEHQNVSDSDEESLPEKAPAVNTSQVNDYIDQEMNIDSIDEFEGIDLGDFYEENHSDTYR